MYQKTIIIGRLTRDPEMRYMPDGTAITNLNVAVGDRKKDASGNYTDHTTWFRVSVWGKQGENANQYLSKGKLVYIEGTLKSDAGGNPPTFAKKDGSTGASFELTAREVKYLSPAGENGGGNAPAPASVADEDDPF